MSGPDQIKPLRLDVPESELDDLRRRLRDTRWPDAQPVPDWSQGAPLSVVRDWAGYWADDYDWRRLESELNAAGQAVTGIDGLDVHFLHVRSPRPDARPLLITHGWPSSVVEPLQVIPALTDPPSAADPAFHVVAPSLPGFGFGGRPTVTGWGVQRTADAWAELMTRLGYERFLVAGGDWGGRVTAALGSSFPDRVDGLHTFTPYVAEPPEGTGRLTELEDRWVADTRRFHDFGSGYSRQQSTRPQTLGYGLVDSPVALLAWVLDKFHSWTDHTGDVQQAVSRDRVLDTVMLYWLTATGASAVRFYWENFPANRGAEQVRVPSAVTVFPADIEKFPRHWVERRFERLGYWNVAERGGHFPMLEVPESYAAELRAAFGRMVN